MTAPYTLVGTPFSTFTRAIALGLKHKGLAFNQISTPPSTSIAFEHHPYGYLPTLIIHEIDGKRVDVKLRESHAILRYIDRVAPEPKLEIKSGEGGALVEEKMWEFVSLVAFFGFPTVEAGVVKPRVKALDEGKLSDTEIRRQIQEGVAKLSEYLALTVSLMAPEGFAFGEKLTWADFFLYPLLADLRTVPEWNEITPPRILSWMKHMDQVEAVKATAAGTLEVGARP